MNAGVLDHKATFQRAIEEVDADGRIVQGWSDQFEAWAGVRYLRGGEEVMQARMASRMPAILTIYNSQQARQITSEWRVRVRDRSGTTRLFVIKEDPRPTDGAGFLEMLAEAT